jgi:uncharacterized protein YegP (UPF0339 family)
MCIFHRDVLRRGRIQRGSTAAIEVLTVPSGRFEVYQARAGQVAWRLLSNNNRDLGRAPATFATEPECLAAIAHLRLHVAEATSIVYRADPGNWSWRLRHDDTDLAMSARLYQRHLQATAVCALFVEMVPDAELSTRYARIPPRAGD